RRTDCRSACLLLWWEQSRRPIWRTARNHPAYSQLGHAAQHQCNQTCVTQGHLALERAPFLPAAVMLPHALLCRMLSICHLPSLPLIRKTRSLLFRPEACTNESIAVAVVPDWFTGP